MLSLPFLGKWNYTRVVEQVGRFIFYMGPLMVARANCIWADAFLRRTQARHMSLYFAYAALRRS